jgi:gliding motility-associated-like protein
MNHGFQLLQTLYSSAFGKYAKFKYRFDKAVQSGKFKKLHKRKQASLISRLKRLYDRLKSLQTQLRLAGAGAAFSLAVSLSNPVSAQSGLGPFERNDAANPLPPPHVISHPRVAMVDIDNDGDVDALIGNADGDILFFRNDSPAGTVSRFVAVTGSENPLDGINKGAHAAPAFADIDGDGDLDMLLGVNAPFYNPPGGPNQYDYSPTFFFRNTGTAANPVFTEQTGVNNPFDGIYGNKYGPSIPVFANIDGGADLDVDLFMGGSYSSDLYGANPAVQYFENQGTVTEPSFVMTAHPLLTSIQFFRETSLAFADFDNDGDLDAFVGQYYSGYGIRTFRNDGSSFTQMPNETNPAYGFYYARSGSPAFGDVDGDGDLDFVVGNANFNRMSVLFAENTGNFNLQQKNDLNLSPFGGVDVGNDAAPAFLDIDNDGDLDAVIGSKYSSQSVSVFINNEGLFIADPDNPIIDIVEGSNITPVFVDIDNDGDADLFHGGRSITFFRNVGTASAPEFEEDENLFLSLSSYNAYDLTISFIDLDNDGDRDALIGNDDYGNRGVSYFENTGSATSPAFTPADPPAPFDEADLFEFNPNVVAIDLDNDGDLDLAITETYYFGGYDYNNFARTRFFENTGNNFTEMESPLLTALTPQSLTTFADIDGDGDLDAFVGNGYSFDFQEDGRVFYYENINPAPVTQVTQNSVSVSLNTPVRLDPDLNIQDDDEDDIVLATVTISNFSAGNEFLDFTPSAGVTGEFEAGVLTIRGKASLGDYETILQSVTYEATGNVTSARQSARAGVPPAKTVTFSVRDTDFTETVVSVVSVITLNITGESGGITVYNAVSPGVTQGENDYMRIEGLSADNQVTIFNRWGDQVFKTSGYNNNTKRFEGKNDNGKDLPAGTYFYTIEVSGKTITGYLSLKR